MYINSIGIPVSELSYASAQFDFLDDDQLQNLYTDWVSNDTFLIIKKTQNENVEYKFMKAAKRGNDIYQYKLNKKLSTLKENVLAGIESYQHVDSSSTNTFFITLTTDPKNYENSKTAWHDLSYQLNLFLANFYKKLKNHYASMGFKLKIKINKLRSYEMHENSYPHVHLLIQMYTVDYAGHITPLVISDCFNFNNKNRAPDWLNNMVHDAWTSQIVDVQAIIQNQSGIALVDYILKYIFKNEWNKLNDVSVKHTLCLAYQWALGMRSYACSRAFVRTTNDLIVKSITQTREINYEFIGLIEFKNLNEFLQKKEMLDKYKNKDNVQKWSYVLDDIDAILSFIYMPSHLKIRYGRQKYRQRRSFGGAS